MQRFSVDESRYGECRLCPRACGVNRLAGQTGVCGASATLSIGRAALHWWEEPCLVGDRGSGAVFFSWCPLGCVYCQNQGLVAGEGIEVDEGRFARAVLRLQNEEGAANINLVTATQYIPTVAAVLGALRASGELRVPVVYNTSSYESPEALRLLDGVVDVYLADYKYASSALARRLSHAADYPSVALAAIDEMVRQAPQWREGKDGLLEGGVIVRHLVLPGQTDDSIAVLDTLHRRYGSRVRLSIMSQYTPVAARAARYGLEGVVSSEDYERVLDHADALGIEEYFWQEGGAAEESFIPAFDGTGV